MCGLQGVDNAELNPNAPELLIVPLRCSLLGEEAVVTVRPGTVAAGAMGAGSSTERFFCRYGLNAEYEGVLESNGLVISGRDESATPVWPSWLVTRSSSAPCSSRS